MRTFLDLAGMYQHVPSLFQLFKLPKEIDRGVFFDNLMMQCLELELRYTEPETMRTMMGFWSKRRLPIWENLAETLHYEYDPISNYDRKENWHEVTDRDRTHSDTNEHEDNDSSTRNLTDSGDHSTTTNVSGDNSGNTTGGSTEGSKGVSTDKLSRTSFNSNELQLAEQRDLTTTNDITRDEHSTTSGEYGEKTTVSGDTSNTQDETITRNTSGNFSNEGLENEDTDFHHEGRMYGNIGVTTTQALIQEQRELVQFDLMEFIIKDFQGEFCLLVY